VLSSGETTRISPAVAARAPRVGPPRQQPVHPHSPQGESARRQPGTERPGTDTRRLIAVLAGIVAVVVVAAVLILSLGGGGGVSLQQNWSSNAPTAVQQMQSLVANNQQ
jgi:hypothetical protein